LGDVVVKSSDHRRPEEALQGEQRGDPVLGGGSTLLDAGEVALVAVRSVSA
jgi:hypothetical protein